MLDIYRSGSPVRPSDISIVIPTLNRSHDLVEAVVALQHQSLQHFEVLVVDNGPSTDDTKEKMTILCDADPRVIYIRTDIKGDSFARNIGCEHASARYLVVTDDDYELTDTRTLQYIYERFETEENLGIIGVGQDYSADVKDMSLVRKLYYACARIIYRPGGISRWGRVSTRSYYLQYGLDHDVAHVKGACFAMRRQIACSFGYFPTMYMLDGIAYRSETEVCRRFAALGYRISFTTRITGVHKATPRPPGTQSRERNILSVWQWSKNNTIFILRNYWTRKTAPIFHTWDLVVGSPNQPGALRILTPKYFMQLAIIRSSISGKRTGYHLYMEKYHDLSITD